MSPERRGVTDALGRAADTALDRSVALGFSRIGPAVRRRLSAWPADPPAGALAGQHAAVTGATSGLGLATALGLLRLGATVHLVVRSTDKAERVRAELLDRVPGGVVQVHRCDVADLDDVRRLGARLVAEIPRLDVLVHNAGALPATRTESPQGHELTMALHVLGPVLMTDLLLPLMAGRGARVVLVTSGGMYAQRLRDDDPEYRAGEYSGTTAYARSKRAQVELLPVLQDRWRAAGVEVYATHPGWVDTPGLAESLPTFSRLVGPFLRDADAGAETTVWLAAQEPPLPGGGLWHDRRERPTHVRPGTRADPAAVRRMGDWVAGQVGAAD
ncbi:SDR family NAD(P)-dependent oxidoreductase [Nocardioides sp. GY 10113]|uniref:SDR family NAD(P)-dependent oxidoreductase n=1 Tax=Nocardioides sp. GY 10113 TaxID=2569761 RepID=UPI0010A8A51C|nr:SDR family NAD(P)-dependent oxidoreductase [Nocardioides sp. GY 10113]TIC84892.1 SDR family NAD(P)-dependent oxidoreductase [Nocardioides sp. GY 10113]